MGLRIQSNGSSLFVLSQLAKQNRMIGLHSERIASGRRINHASDDPSGLVAAENLRNQYTSLQRAVDNAEFAKNLVDTADSAMEEVSNLLIDIRAAALDALNDPSQVPVLQDEIDAAIESISSIANGTRFGNLNLLNGQAGYRVNFSNRTIMDAEVRRLRFQPGLNGITVSSVITTRASQAVLVAGTTGAGTTVLRVTGPLGSKDVSLASGSTNVQVRTAINSVRDFTGVFGSTNNSVYSEDFGSAATISITQISGTYSLGAQADSGRDLAGTINGRRATGRGSTLTVGGSDLSLTVTFSDSAPLGAQRFSAFRGGFNLQIGSEPTASDELIFGIESVDPGSLGRRPETIAGETVGGWLADVKAGASNDLSTNPGNAIRIIDSALDEVNSLRAFLGSISANTLQPTIDSYTQTIANLQDTESLIRNADIAVETQQLVGAQILAQASVAVLGQANLLNSGLVSTLLGFTTNSL